MFDSYELIKSTDYLLIIPEKKKGIYYSPTGETEYEIINNPREMIKDRFKKLDPKEAMEVLNEVRSEIAEDISKSVLKTLITIKKLEKVGKLLYDI